MTEQALFQQFNRNQQRESLDKAKETGLFISLIPSLQEHFYVDSLTTGANQETLSKLLQRSPRIKNETAVIEMIHFLHDEGDRTSFSILLHFLLSEYAPKELEEKLRERFFGIELFIRKCNNLHNFITCTKAGQAVEIKEEDLKKGVLAWDMGRMVCLVRIAYDTGYINEDLAWNYICSAGQQCMQAFSNWTEVGKSFLLGQAMEASEKEKQERNISLYRKATEDEESPWKKRTLK